MNEANDINRDTNKHSDLTPLVSVRCLCYNHAPFLRQCLDGFVMQETDFPFEVVIHDDASTDGSADIIREYAERFPGIIRPIYETENQYGKPGVSIGRIVDAALHPSSRYVAFCEGDDYWTDPHKLQRQFDFLESHPEYVICTHQFDVLQDGKFTPYHNDTILQGTTAQGFVPFSKVDNITHWFTQPLTCMYRRGQYLEQIPRQRYTKFWDTILYYYILRQGNGALLPQSMGVYRRHSGGVYTSTSRLTHLRRAYMSFLQIYQVERDPDVLPFLDRHQMFQTAQQLRHLKLGQAFSDLRTYARATSWLHVPVAAYRVTLRKLHKH